MANVTFTDNTAEVKEAIRENSWAILEEITGELESQVKRNTRVKTGQTKNSWQHVVVEDGENLVGIVGSNHENAIWEEFGTGEHALQGDGRKGGWWYKDDEGKWHHTFGKKPSRALHKAFSSSKNKIINRIQNVFKGLK
ncbi:MAG: HK97 gp10 family phage protein [Bacteroidales bacterium]|nr:HK97 gp10 family phage protein [Bacteroidales bacterium]